MWYCVDYGSSRLIKPFSQTNFPLKMQYRENLENESVDMAKVKCNIGGWIVVGNVFKNNT